MWTLELSVWVGNATGLVTRDVLESVADNLDGMLAGALAFHVDASRIYAGDEVYCSYSEFLDRLDKLKSGRDNTVGVRLYFSVLDVRVPLYEVCSRVRDVLSPLCSDMLTAFVIKDNCEGVLVTNCEEFF